ncbi:proton-conducting transporter transmembrane domain-containing protein [Anaeromyxobacter diazotrophicus]|uniref:Hydrogenase n=1 Tax=Anaeromyxobacter diazotrophicus TaxID=2590199 RepID=A0A7I9VKI9_9BACT|nr:proton-conducting transporter membrane subunit [Anaeromyxobacter diazotrophicus]GEJ56895.1 hydrogenase [Anaeromyxobacter diazotrophicus]
MSLALVLAGLVLASCSGGAALALRRAPALAQRAACAVLVAGAALGIAGAALALGGAAPAGLHARWSVPGGALAVRLDALGAVFLLPVFGIPAAGSVYGLAYFAQARRGAQALRLQGFYGLVTGAMALVVLAANAMLFLAAWEVMALCGFLLVLTEQEKPEVQRAGFVYLAATHVGTLALFALFALLGSAAGSFDFARMAGAGLPATWGVFALALLGFGLKAGLMPLHFWLPGAHAAAPSHVSALLSGVLLKTGLYGILRVTGFFAAPPLGWGLALLAVGAASAVLGVAFALAQHDLKRLLAYHSVENVGIIAMGIGLALVGRAVGDPALVLLGFAGGALHVVNHALFKALLFLGAGAVDHACGTRELDRLGGLARAMPLTAALFLLGAVAISALPPLNGFVSEWLVYLGALRALSAPSLAAWAALAAPALALVGGLAAACFAKVFGTVFLGTPRSDQGARAHEAARAMLAPMAGLAACCVLIGLFPGLLLPALRRAASAWAPPAAGLAAGAARSAVDSASALTGCAAVLLAAAGLLAAWRRRRARGAPAAETWGCGYTRPTARMQYTGSSFAEMLTLRFGWAFFPRARVEPPRGPFPRRATFSSHVPDTVLDVALLPLLASASWGAERVRRLHRGQVQGQALLVGLTLLALLAWRFLWW